MKRFLQAVCSCAIVLAMSSVAQASIAGYEFGSVGSSSTANGPWTLGFRFQANQNMTVTHLGMYDHDQDGLAQSHLVGLWADDGTLLASTTVLSGTGSALSGHFRWESISGVNLTSGNSYRVGAADLAGSPPDAYAWNNSGEVANGITLQGDRWTLGSGLLFPVNSDGVSVLVGGNFMWDDGRVVPEPGTIAIWSVLGLVGLGVRRRKGA